MSMCLLTEACSYRDHMQIQKMICLLPTLSWMPVRALRYDMCNSQLSVHCFNDLPKLKDSASLATLTTLTTLTTLATLATLAARGRNTFLSNFKSHLKTLFVVPDTQHDGISNLSAKCCLIGYWIWENMQSSLDSNRSKRQIKFWESRQIFTVCFCII